MFSCGSRESNQWVVIVQRSLSATEKILDDVSNNRLKEVRDGCLIVLSLVDLVQSMFPESEYVDVMSTCSNVLHIVLALPIFSGEYQPAALPTQSMPPTVAPFATRNITFSSIIGSDEAKQALFENVVLPLSISDCKRSQIFKGVRSGGGNVLLFGPPGKTQMAQAAAYESNSMMFYIRPSEILSKYQGESERYIARLFAEARAVDRAVIFFDEFDSVATARGLGDETGNNRRLLAELLLQLTLHRQQQNAPTTRKAAGNVVVIAATNRLQDLDEAVLRRFDSKVYVSTPSEADRMDMVLFFLRDIDHSLSDQSRADIARDTEGWSGSEIESLCREAAMIPIREALPYKSTAKSPISQISSVSQSTVHGTANSHAESKCDTAQIHHHFTFIRPVTIEDFGAAHEALMKPHTHLLEDSGNRVEVVEVGNGN